MSNEPHKAGLMRSLGAFVGEIVKAVKSDPTQEERPDPREPGDLHDPARDERVVLRRTTTTVDEVVVRKRETDE